MPATGGQNKLILGTSRATQSELTELQDALRWLAPRASNGRGMSARRSSCRRPELARSTISFRCPRCDHQLTIGGGCVRQAEERLERKPPDQGVAALCRND
jgi:hypothetical protein